MPKKSQRNEEQNNNIEEVNLDEIEIGEEFDDKEIAEFSEDDLEDDF